MATDITSPTLKRGQRRPVSPGPLTNALLHAIDQYGNHQALGRASGVLPESISVFRCRLYGLRLDAIQKIASVVGLRLAKADGCGGDEQDIKDVLLLEIPAFVGSINELARISDIPHGNIRDFLRGRRHDLSRSTIDKLIVALGLVVVSKGDVRRIERIEAKPPISHPLEPFFDQLRKAITASGRSPYSLGKEIRIQKSSMYRFFKREQGLRLEDAMRLAKYLGLDPDPSRLAHAAIPPAEPTVSRTKPIAWDDWDATKCPVHVREDGHLVVFGDDKGSLNSENATQLVSDLAGLYIPGGRGGYNKNTLLDKFGFGARGLFGRIKGIDDGCKVAFQSPGPKKEGPYGIWRRNN